MQVFLTLWNNFSSLALRRSIGQSRPGLSLSKAPSSIKTSLSWTQWINLNGLKRKVSPSTSLSLACRWTWDAPRRTTRSGRFKGWQHYLHTWKDRIKQSPWCVEPLLPLLRPETTLLSCPCVSWYSAVCCTAHTCGHSSVLGDSVFCDPNVSGQRHFGHEEQSVRTVETFPSHTPFLPTPSFPVYPRDADWVLFLLLRYVW